MAPVPLPWYCEDVNFDRKAADNAVVSLRQLERYVRSLAETRGNAAAEPYRDWSGRFADDFAREFHTTEEALFGVADGIGRLVGRIHDGIEAAVTDQSTRLRLRASCTEPNCCHGHR
ncbi:MAG: hypothetical protein ACRDTX_22775 [Pseudonocardiaceae bacterium]